VVVLSEPELELLELADIVAHLGDDETGAGRYLTLQLVVLPYDLGLILLEGRKSHAAEETGGGQGGLLEHNLVLHPLVHLGDQLEAGHRIEIEYRSRGPLKRGVGGIVAGQYEEVVDIHGRELVEQALTLVAAAVTKRHVHQRFHAQLADLSGKDLGGDGRIASGVVGHADGADLAASGCLPGVVEDRLLPFLE
jgi:hypothetical protein